MRNGRVSLERVRFLVVDEADRMMANNSMDDLLDVVQHPSMPERERRQTLMYSATFPEPIQALAKSILNDGYLFCAVGVVGAANTDVKQKLIATRKQDKREKLLEILKDLIKKD